MIRIAFSYVVAGALWTVSGVAAFPAEVVLKYEEVQGICPGQEGQGYTCWKYQTRSGSVDVPADLKKKRDENTFQVYTAEETKNHVAAIIKAEADKINELITAINTRLSKDEAELPRMIDEHAVEKLLDKIEALEARVRQIEGAKQ